MATNKEVTVKFFKGNSDAILPTRGTNGAAGLDLTACKKTTIATNTTGLVETGLHVEIPEGYVGIIKIRSGFAKKYNVTENAGVVDSDYRGPLKVAIANFSSDPLKIVKGDRIAQLLIIPCWTGKVVEITELSETDRGENGFGSTGN